MRDVLAGADLVAAEDTRRLARLARDLDIELTGRVVSYFEGNEDRRTPEIVEASRRLAATLADLAAAFGADRPAAVCRELTKTYEEVLRRPLGGLAQWAGAQPPRGEITLVVGGAPAVPVVRPDDGRLRAEVAG